MGKYSTKLGQLKIGKDTRVKLQTSPSPYDDLSTPKGGLSRVLSGPSPLSVIENMLRGQKPDEVEVRRNDVVRPGN